MRITFAGISQGKEEIDAVMRVLESKWHANGYECDTLEKELASYIGTPYACVVNSGSSANLLAIKALELPQGSKVLTSGCGFPATLFPIIHAGHKPVLVDYELPSHNIDLDQVEQELKNNDIRAIIIAHTMANPVDMNRLMTMASFHSVPVIEDCCEALGSRINGKLVGSFGDFGTFSFYPSHQINGMGGGGAVTCKSKDHALKLRSMREWGKIIELDFAGDHHTKPTNEIDGIPYDSHYTYITQGFNFKYPDVNCAYTRVQLDRLKGFIGDRQRNHKYLAEKMNKFKKYFMPMKVIEGAELANFGYTLTLSKLAPFSRDELLEYLEEHEVGTRLFFAGNITRHKPFRHLYKEFPVADYTMKNSMFVGCWHGLELSDMEYIYQTIGRFIDEHCGSRGR